MEDGPLKEVEDVDLKGISSSDPVAGLISVTIDMARRLGPMYEDACNVLIPVKMMNEFKIMELPSGEDLKLLDSSVKSAKESSGSEEDKIDFIKGAYIKLRKRFLKSE